MDDKYYQIFDVEMSRVEQMIVDVLATNIFAGDLGAPIGFPGGCRCRRPNRNLQRYAEDSGRRGVDDFLHTADSAGFQQVAGAAQVDLVHERRILRNRLLRNVVMHYLSVRAGCSG